MKSQPSPRRSSLRPLHQFPREPLSQFFVAAFTTQERARFTDERDLVANSSRKRGVPPVPPKHWHAPEQRRSTGADSASIGPEGGPPNQSRG